MAGSVRDYLSKMETSQLQMMKRSLSYPRYRDEYDYAIPIIEEVIEERLKASAKLKEGNTELK